MFFTTFCHINQLFQVFNQIFSNFQAMHINLSFDMFVSGAKQPNLIFSTVLILTVDTTLPL